MTTVFTSPVSATPKHSTPATAFSGKTPIMGRRAVRFLLAATGAAMLAAPTVAQEAFPVEGYWLTNGGTSIVELAPCGTSHKKLCGNVVWAEDGGDGATILKNFRLAGSKAGDLWTHGKISIDGKKKAQKGKLTFRNDTLRVSVCKGTRCKNQTWTRPSATMTAQIAKNDGAE